MTTTEERPRALVSPEIDGVMISLKRVHDDGLADDYFRLVELATGPRAEQEVVQGRIKEILLKLHSEDRFITAALTHGATLLNDPTLPQVYYGVLGQVKELAQIDN